MSTNRVVSFPPSELTIPLEVNSLQFQLRKPHSVYLTTVVVYCSQKFNLQLNFTITFQIRDKTNQHL